MGKGEKNELKSHIKMYLIEPLKYIFMCLSSSEPSEKTNLKGKLSLSCEAKIRGSQDKGQEGGGQGQEDPQFLTLMGRTADISRSLRKRGVDTIKENEEILEYIVEKQNI